MTTTAPGDTLSPRIEAVERELREVHAGLAAGRRTRLFVLLLVIAFVIAITLMFYSLYARVTSEQFVQDLSTAAQAHLEANKNIYTHEVQTLLDNAKPVLRTAFEAQMEKDMPRFSAAVGTERQVLVDNLRPELEELVKAQYDETLTSFRQTLADQFPEAKDPVVQNRIKDNLDAALTGLVDRYYVNQFQTQMQALSDTWEKFPVADAPGPEDAPLTDQLIGLLLEIMKDRLANPPEEAML